MKERVFEERPNGCARALGLYGVLLFWGSAGGVLVLGKPTWLAVVLVLAGLFFGYLFAINTIKAARRGAIAVTGRKK